MSNLAIRVENLGKQYRIGGPQARYKTLRETLNGVATAPLRRLRSIARGRSSGSHDTIWALRDVSFEVRPGEVVGIIGRNGAGKSTLLKILSRITEPTEGYAELHGRVGTLLEVGTGFHPELTGRENIYLNGAILGMQRTEIDRKFDEIVAFAEVERFIDTPVKHYSSGMYLRLAFAVAAHLDPEILIVDEVLAVGDAQFQKKCLGKMEDVARQGRTVLFVSHNMQAVRQMCERLILLQQGQVSYIGAPGPAIVQYFGGGEEHSSVIDLTGLPRRSHNTGALLRSVQFLNARNEPAQRFLPSEQLRVQVGFAASRRLERLEIAMALVYSDGTPVFSESLSDQAEPEPLAPGAYEFEMLLDLKYLKFEPYFLTIYLLDDGRPLDNVEGIALPELYDPAADTFKESHRWGVARIPIRWSEIRQPERRNTLSPPS
jgi:lipopolysaccharide transport system ATP-binding protein